MTPCVCTKSGDTAVRLPWFHAYGHERRNELHCSLASESSSQTVIGLEALSPSAEGLCRIPEVVRLQG